MSQLFPFQTFNYDVEILFCFLCCKHFRANGDKSSDLKTHSSKKFQPEEKFKATSQEGNLSPHVKMQRVAKVKQGFSSCKCFKIFSLRSYLKRNQLIHVGVKPFQCHDCEMKFVQSSHLKLHQGSKHTLERPLNVMIVK